VEDQSLNSEKNKTEKDLYYEYVESYKKVIEYIPKVKKQIKDLRIEYKNINQEDNNKLENTKIKINQKTNERNYLLSAEASLLYIMMWLERYLPYEKRYYSRKYDEEQRKLTYDKKSDTGIVFEENTNRKAIDELVHNKILKNELLCILKDLLTDKQYTCMFMYYYEGYTQEQIADKLRISQPEIVDKIKTSIDKIRNSEYFLNILENLS
jgi:predicted DNA-binding protein YlxM (UPF0122 family)